MIRLPKILFALVPLFLFGGCRILAPTQEVRPDAPGVEYLQSERLVSDLERDLFTLASDEFRGREAATPDERRAAEYIAQQLQSAGLQPGGNGQNARSFFQTFELETVQFDTAHTRLAFAGIGEAVLGRDWISFPEHSPVVLMDSVGIVFAGYGIADPRQGHDDYALIDPVGKIVVALAGAPEGLDSVVTFNGAFAPGDFLVKWLAAAQRGAVAIIVIGEPDALDLWEDYATISVGRSMSLPEEELYIPAMPYIFLSESYGDRWLQALNASPDSLTVPVELADSVTLHLAPRRSVATTQNVIAYVPGTLATDEFVALGAHYDHLGMKNGDVFNGADDNASGVVSLLAVARGLALDVADGASLDRSAVFVFHAAEEKGLLGATYVTAYPETSIIGEIENVVAHVNLDMVGREHPDSLYVAGAYRLSSTLGELVDELNQALGEDGPLFYFDRTYDAPDDPERIFERSDHYEYALKGVPVVFFTDGMGANWKKGTDEDDYHSVTDDPEKIDVNKIARVTRLVYHLSRRAADASVQFEIDGTIPTE